MANLVLCVEQITLNLKSRKWSWIWTKSSYNPNQWDTTTWNNTLIQPELAPSLGLCSGRWSRINSRFRSLDLWVISAQGWKSWIMSRLHPLYIWFYPPSPGMRLWIRSRLYSLDIWFDSPLGVGSGLTLLLGLLVQLLPHTRSWFRSTLHFLEFWLSFTQIWGVGSGPVSWLLIQQWGDLATVPKLLLLGDCSGFPAGGKLILQHSNIFKSLTSVYTTKWV